MQTIKHALKKIRIKILLLFKYHIKSVGKNFYCGKHLWIWKESKLVFGNDVYIGNYCHIAVKELFIGDSTLIASYVSFIGGDHKFDDINMNIRDSGIGDLKGIKIGQDCWIGHGSIIFDGVSIGNRSIIGAGSIVTKDVPEGKIVAGNPATIIRDRFGN